MTTKNKFSPPFKDVQNVISNNNNTNGHYSNLNLGLNQNCQYSSDAFFKPRKNVSLQKRKSLNYGNTNLCFCSPSKKKIFY